MIETRRIGRTRLQLPVLGLGCAAIGNLYRRVEDAAAAATLEAAWQGGIRCFDTAPHYGHGLSETRLGAFLEHRSRQGCLVSTKVGRSLVAVPPGREPDFGFVDPLPYAPAFDYSAQAVKEQVASSCARLNLDRVDILYVHDIGRMTHGERHEPVLKAALDGAFPMLRELKRDGAVTAMGIGVNEVDVCLEVLEQTAIDVILLAGRYTLLEQGALDRLLPRCEAENVSVVIGGPYNSGLLVGDNRYDYGRVPKPVALRRDRLAAACADYGVPLAAAALQFPLAHPAVAAVIPGARSPEEARENIRHSQTPIPATLWSSLKEQELLRPDAPVPQ